MSAHRLYGGIEWERIPWPLWIYAVIALAPVIPVEIGARGPVGVKILLPVVMLAWLFFLFRGVRWVWMVTVAIDTLGFVPSVISGSLTWWGATMGLLSVLLLLLPATRQHFSGESVAGQRPSDIDPVGDG
ncbi:MAG TPA: hypothetical protein VG816_02935 [Solirubrobacterales bacterium]|nr:hypothetical protein [Solirubrobacterales bacterium]